MLPPEPMGRIGERQQCRVQTKKLFGISSLSRHYTVELMVHDTCDKPPGGDNHIQVPNVKNWFWA
jgi:hypothetical protein